MHPLARVATHADGVARGTYNSTIRSDGNIPGAVGDTLTKVQVVAWVLIRCMVDGL